MCTPVHRSNRGFVLGPVGLATEMTVLLTVLLIRSAHETQSLQSPSTPRLALTPKMSSLLPLLLLLVC